MIGVPSARRPMTSVLTAPSVLALGPIEPSAGITACLCGTVTFAPQKPSAASPRTATSTCPGGTGSGR